MVRLGWTTAELFSVNTTVGVVRFDGCGALVTNDRPVAAIEPRAIVSGNLRAYQGRPGQTYGVPIWHYVSPVAAPKKMDGWR